MKCPFCGSLTRVLNTRGEVRRRRECDKGHRFTTVEMLLRRTLKEKTDA